MGMPETRSVRIEGVATALSSISHIDQRAGTISLFRRQKIVDPAGAVAAVPVVKGNALRGVLRRYCAEVFTAALGRPRLPPPVFDLLFSGGSLAKAGAGHVLSARQLVTVRDLIPMVSVFGGSGAGRIIEGKLSVLDLTPICVETAHLLPAGIAEASPPPPCRELLQVEEFTRRDDAKNPAYAPLIDDPSMLPAATSTDSGHLIPAGDDTGRPGLERIMQMRYGAETLAAGTRLHWGIRIRHATDVEISLLAAGLDAWITDGAHIGGRAATGHGRLRLDVHQWQTVTPATTVGEALAVTGRDDLADHIAANRAEILDTLGWFT